MNWNKTSGWLAVGLIVACAVALIIMGTSNPVQSSALDATLKATPVVEVIYYGKHNSIWKFWDNNRECYFNSSGGIWCTP